VPNFDGNFEQNVRGLKYFKERQKVTGFTNYDLGVMVGIKIAGFRFPIYDLKEIPN
jgi:hypothetical protein